MVIDDEAFCEMKFPESNIIRLFNLPTKIVLNESYMILKYNIIEHYVPN
jgi:hypothetical protein